MKPRLLISVLVTLSALLQPVASSLVRAQITFTDTITPPNNYSVNYTNDNPPPAVDANYFTTAQAQRVANALSNSNVAAVGNPNGNHGGFTGLGFLAPSFNGLATRNVNIFDCSLVGGCDSGNAPKDRIQMPAGNYLAQTEPCIRLVIGHELFHHVQYAYINFSNWVSWGREFVEGSARVMQDKLYSDLDNNSGCITYQSATADWLNAPNQNIFGVSYTFALFWNYLMEQLGATATEPQVGVDFLLSFAQRAQSATAAGNIDFVGTLRNTIAAFSSARSLEELYLDFGIANYTKLMDVSALPDSDRYQYVDEIKGTANVYVDVARDVDAVLSTSSALGINTSSTVNTWGAEYYVVETDSDCRNKNTVIGFRADGDKLRWALVSSKNTDDVVRIDRGYTENFRRALLNRAEDPYTQLAAIAVNTENAAGSHTSLFACGDARVQILDPLSSPDSRRAYVGDLGDPDRFLVRVLALGPAALGDPSIEGLLPTDFEVFVGNIAVPANKATVVSGAHVQGEYWLVVQPPTRGPADPTVYDLTVRLNNATDTEEEAVVYEKKIIDQMLVIDRSGSMNYPAGYEKIVAARNAAKLFIDSARDDDQLGAVSFSGSNEEAVVVDDSTVEYTLTLVAPLSRELGKDKIDAIDADGWTSIGDGLFTARSQLTAFGNAGEDWIVLLSDGMENEDRKWAQVANAITTAGIRVNTIALGPYTDQALLQQIANQTGGTYYYVNSEAYAARGAAVFDPTANELADAYALANERQRRHQRVWDWASESVAGTTGTTFELEAGGLKDALFTLNWPSGGSLDLELERPDGSIVRTTDPGVVRRSDGTYVVVNMNSMPGGVWTVRVTGESDVPFMAILSGVPVNDVEMRTWLAQRPLQTGDLRGLYLRGLPMPILASVSDMAGPVRSVTVTAEVLHPMGERITLPLFDDGNHGDGDADDGVYGNLYRITTHSSPRSQNNDFLTPTITTTVQSANGSYRVIVHADGKDNKGERFHRMNKTAFQVYEVEPRDKEANLDTNYDYDGDGMPDRYELLHPCLDPYDYNDALEDADQDGAYTRTEWEYLGTDPCDPDTDGGGEADGSETTPNYGGVVQNPFDPSDDRLPTPIDVEVVDWVADHMPDPPVASQANLIRYPAHPSYESIRLRRWYGAQPYEFNDVVFSSTLYSGVYTDTDLINGKIYTYVVYGLGTDGAQSAPSPIFYGTPKADPLPPRGGVFIADGRPQISRRTTSVMLESDPDATEYMLSNDPEFTGASWRPFTHSAPYSLTVRVTHTLGTSAGVAVVYAKFRDDAGNVSDRYSDDVLVKPARFFGIIRGVLKLRPLLPREEHSALAALHADEPPTTTAGALVWCANMPDVAPTLAAEDGSFELTDVPTGRCALRALQDGYRPHTEFVEAVSETVVTVTNEIELVQRVGGEPSSEAALADLAISPGALAQAFVSSTLRYTGTVPGTASQVAVLAVATHPSATLLYESSAGACAGAVCPLGGDATALTVTVTAEDGIVDLRYSVEIGRDALNDEAALADLAISPGTLTPTFVSSTLRYNAAVPRATSSVIITAAAASNLATVAYESSAGACADAVCPLGSTATALTVTVTAEDGVAEQRYFVAVSRAGSMVYVPFTMLR